MFAFLALRIKRFAGDHTQRRVHAGKDKERLLYFRRGVL
jgi:hypothetical protein